jgi:hypothetical protein
MNITSTAALLEQLTSKYHEHTAREGHLDGQIFLAWESRRLGLRQYYHCLGAVVK